MKALPTGVPLPSGVKNLPNGVSLSGYAGTPKDLPSGTLVGEFISLTLVAAANGYGDTFVNTMILRQSNPVTDFNGDVETQFMAWHKQIPKTLMTAKRVRNPDKSWGAWTVDTTAITPTSAEDAHCYFSLAPDSAGGFLLSGDMHGVDMNYTHMQNGDLHVTAWDAVPIVSGATNEDTVTYPDFLPLPNGDVLFFWRDGASGEGNLVLTKWVKATDTVVAVVDVLVDGEGVESFYPWRTEYDPLRDEVHIAGCWRQSTAVNTNHGLIHFKLVGPNFTTAITASGAAQTIPVTRANAAYAASDAINTGMTNVGSISLDSVTGYPSLWSYTDPGDGFSQVYAQVYNGATWTRHFAPNVHQYANQIPFSLVNDGSSGPDYIPFSSPVALRLPDSERVIMVGRSDSQGVGVRALIYEDGNSLLLPIWHLIDSTDVGVWFGAEDYTQWRNNHELYFLHQFSKQPVDPNVGAQNVSILHWVPQEAPYDYVAPPTLFDPDDYPGCLFYLAPRVGGAQARGTTGADRTRIVGFKEARNDDVLGTNLFVQATASDAPNYTWNYFNSNPGRAGVTSVAATQDFMVCTDATIRAALAGINTPFAICQVVVPTDTASCRFGSFGNSGDTTQYVDWGIEATGKFVFNRRVVGTEKRTTGTAAVVAGKKYVVWWVFDDTNGWIEANNVADGTPASFTFAGSMTITQLSLFCRRRAGNDLYASMTQGNFVVYTTVPSLAERQQITIDLAAENYFSL